MADIRVGGYRIRTGAHVRTRAVAAVGLQPEDETKSHLQVVALCPRLLCFDGNYSQFLCLVCCAENNSQHTKRAPSWYPNINPKVSETWGPGVGRPPGPTCRWGRYHGIGPTHVGHSHVELRCTRRPCMCKRSMHIKVGGVHLHVHTPHVCTCTCMYTASMGTCVPILVHTYAQYAHIYEVAHNMYMSGFLEIL